MARFEGLTVAEMVEYIRSVCKKKKYSINQASIVKLLNMANMEVDADNELSLSYWEATSEEDVNYYALPDEVNIVHDVFMVETGSDGLKPLKPATFKQIQASLAEDDSDVVEP